MREEGGRAYEVAAIELGIETLRRSWRFRLNDGVVVPAAPRIRPLLFCLSSCQGLPAWGLEEELPQAKRKGYALRPFYLVFAQGLVQRLLLLGGRLRLLVAAEGLLCSLNFLVAFT